MIQFTELSEEQRERVIGSIVEKIKVVGTQETQPPFTPNNRESYSFELHNCSVRVYFVEQGPDWQEDTFVSIKEKFGRPEHLKLMGSGDYCGGIHAFYRGNSQGLVDAVLTNFSFYVPHISGARRLLDRADEQKNFDIDIQFVEGELEKKVRIERSSIDQASFSQRDLAWRKAQ